MTRVRSRIAVAAVVWLGLVGVLAAAPPIPGKRGRTVPPAGSMSVHAAARAFAALQAAKASPGHVTAAPDTLRLVALRVEFPDLAFGASEPADELHDRFYYQVQFSYLQQYFTAASAGRTHVVVDVPDGVAVAASPQSVYGDYDNYDSLMVQLTAEAVTAFDAGVDFAAYDGFILLHAGAGQESDIAGDSPTQIWSGYLDRTRFRDELSTPDSVVTGIPTADGVLVDECIVLPEWEVQDLQVTGGTRTGHLGVFAHEVGQKLGMLPLFDSDPSPIPDSQGIGNFCLMGYGLWVANGFIPALPCAFNRMLVGWVDPIDAPAGGEFVLRDQETGPPDSVVVRVPISAREYFLVSYVREDRDGPVDCGGTAYRRFFRFEDKNQNCRFDYTDVDGDGVLSAGDSIDTYAGAEWDFFMTDLIGADTAGDGFGLLVLHVDELAIQEALAAGRSNVQSDPRRKGVDVEEADGIEDLDRFPDNARAFGSADDYSLRPQVFGPHTVPATASANGAPTGIEIALVALPDSNASALDPDFGLPGERARVRVRRDRVDQPEIALQPGPRRQLDGEFGADSVALPFPGGGAALVVPGPDGALYLLDANLDDLPAQDGDPATLAPWVTLPPAVRGPWAAAPAVGDIDGDAVPEVVVVAADSLLATQTRVFAWHRDGTGAGTDVTVPALVATLNGAPAALLVTDLDTNAGLEIVVATTTPAGVAVWTSPVMCPLAAAGAASFASLQTAGDVLAAGPVGVRWGQCAERRGIAWVTLDSLHQNAVLHFQAPACCTAPIAIDLPEAITLPASMAAGDFDADGNDEIVCVDGSGRVVCATAPEAGTIRVVNALGDGVAAPLAVADLDADGAQELLVACRTSMHALSFSGAERPGWPTFLGRDPGFAAEPSVLAGAGTPLVADVDGDVRPEIIVHAPGGPLLVWAADGTRQPELEAALPAGLAVSPLVADLDADGQAELVALARFAAVDVWDASAATLTTRVRTDCGVWRWPGIGAIAWGELGGGSGHAFRADGAGPLQPLPNTGALGSFVVAPNPATSLVAVRVELTSAATVTCSVYNLEGERVQEAQRTGGVGEIVEFRFDVSSLASGIYLARMEVSGAGSRIRPLVVRR